MTGRVVDSYTNISTVKLFAHADREDGYAREGMDWMLDTVHRLDAHVTLMTVALNAAQRPADVHDVRAVASGCGGSSHHHRRHRLLHRPDLRLKAMSQWIIWEVAGCSRISASSRTASKPSPATQPSSTRPMPSPCRHPGRDPFRQRALQLRQEPRRRLGGIIDDLSLTVRPGEKVGLVGRSGAGKSTLANLLLRFYDLESGRILIDGQDISQVAQESLRAKIGVVTQDTSLLHRSVMDNIRYGMPDAPLSSEAEAAARSAHADEFIADLVDPKGRKGYDAHVGERGVKLSGGQRQRDRHRPRAAQERPDPGSRRGDERPRLRSRSGHPGKSLHA